MKTPDDFQEAWQTQPARTRVTIDADLLLKEVQRNAQAFATMIFWRDVREVGVALVMVPLWVFLGIWMALPWTWYLTIPAMLWVAGYILVDRIRYTRKPAEPGEPLRAGVAGALMEVEHQIRLLRSVLWWYLLPLGLPLLAFIVQFTWNGRSRGWNHVLEGCFLSLCFAFVFGVVYWANQYAVRATLEPRRKELEALLMSLDDEAPEAG